MKGLFVLLFSLSAFGQEAELSKEEEQQHEQYMTCTGHAMRICYQSTQQCITKTWFEDKKKEATQCPDQLLDCIKQAVEDCKKVYTVKDKEAK